MIQVTLTFTSLSAALKALREIPESTLDSALTDITPAEEVAAEPAPKPVKKKPSPAPALEAVPAPAIASPTADPLPGVAPAVSYPELQKAVLLLAGKNRDAAQALATHMGVKTFRELPQDRWHEALAAVNNKIVELGVMQ